MKKIIISQRRDKIANRDEERDATDVRIGNLLFELGFLPIFLCSEITDLPKYISALEPDGILLGSGNDLDEYPRRDQLESYLLDYATEHKIPVLGICRGTQMLNHYLGGSLVTIAGHVATRQKLTGEWAKQHGYTDVNSYHNFAITPATLGKNLDILASTGDGVVKAIKHQSLPWLGIMWHPEREAKIPVADKTIISKHLNNQEFMVTT